MIPLRDTNKNPRQSTPVANTTLIAANVVIFFLELSMSPGQIQAFTYELGIVPARFIRAFGFSQILTLFTSLFLHGGWLHVMGNVWFLWVFGDNIEDRMGHGRYLLFYLLSGAAAGLTHILLAPGSPVPTIGASGAISGVMGAYLVLFPHARIITLIPIFFFFQVIEVPAFVFLIIWLSFQILGGLAAISRGGTPAGGIAWWAHIGGFFAGLWMARRFQVREPPPPETMAFREDLPW